MLETVRVGAEPPSPLGKQKRGRKSVAEPRRQTGKKKGGLLRPPFSSCWPILPESVDSSAIHSPGCDQFAYASFPTKPIFSMPACCAAAITSSTMTYLASASGRMRSSGCSGIAAACFR